MLGKLQRELNCRCLGRLGVRLVGLVFALACCLGAVNVYAQHPTGACCVGAGRVESNTDVPSPAALVARIESVKEVTMNRTAEMVVAFDKRVAEPRGPNAVWEPMPPNAPARSAAFPLCSSTTIIRKRHTTT